MATVLLSPSPILQFFNNSGQPNAGGSLLTQVGGVNYPTYQDSAGTIPLPNPIPLNARGEVSNSSGTTVPLYLVAAVNYVFTLYDANGNQIWQTTNFTESGKSSSYQTATANQTLFTGLSYIVGNNSLSVYVNGSKQIVGLNYTETSSVSITFLTGLNVGDIVEFVIG